MTNSTTNDTPNPTEVDVLALYRAAGAFHEGHFLLASGRHSPKFLQSTTLTQYPHYTAQLAAGLAERLRARGIQAALTVGPAMGGVVPAYEVARALGIRSIFAEKDGAGGMKIREAFSLEAGEPFIAIEDVLTTGGSVMKAVRAAEDAGGKCAAIACIIDRRDPSSDPATLNGYPLVSLTRIHFDTYAPEEVPEWLAAIPLQEI